jgi:hypothetical protein
MNYRYKKHLLTRRVAIVETLVSLINNRFFSIGFTSPLGKHRQKKSGFGRPVTARVDYTGTAA